MNDGLSVKSNPALSNPSGLGRLNMIDSLTIYANVTGSSVAGVEDLHQ